MLYASKAVHVYVLKMVLSFGLVKAAVSALRLSDEGLFNGELEIDVNKHYI